jgi:hypothetical protein
MLSEEETDFWLHASKAALAEVWDNSQDDEYVRLLEE